MKHKNVELKWSVEQRDALMEQRKNGITVVLAVFIFIAFIMSILLVIFLNLLSIKLGNVGAISMMIFVDAGLLYLAAFLPE